MGVIGPSVPTGTARSRCAPADPGVRRGQLVRQVGIAQASRSRSLQRARRHRVLLPFPTVSTRARPRSAWRRVGTTKQAMSRDQRKHRRLDLAQLLRDFVHRVVAYLLADHATVGLDAEQHPTAAMVELSIEHSLRAPSATLAGRALELERLRLACRGPAADLVAGDHRCRWPDRLARGRRACVSHQARTSGTARKSLRQCPMDQTQT